MIDKEISKLEDQEFDILLEEIIDRPPPADLSESFTPWRKAMNRVLWGVGLTTLTLNIWNLDVILPAIGCILMLLGFRTLQRENKWFKAAYITSWLRTIWWLIAFFLNLTIYSGDSEVSALLATGTMIILIPGFITLVSLRNGIRSVQTKTGLPLHGGNGMLVWYLIAIILGLINFSGISVWGLIIAYIFILRNLYKLSKELDEAGYSISPAPVRLSDRVAKTIYLATILVVMVIGYSFFNKYPMDWQMDTSAHNEFAEEIRQELLDMGFPEYVLNDMTNDEILDCSGATVVLVDVRDYDMDQGIGIGTQEEIDNGLRALVTDDKAERQLRTTYIGIKFSDEREHWKIIHHFRWLVDRDFCGTEAIQMLPYSQSGWNVSSGFTGRLLYDLDGATYTSEYYSLAKVTYETTGMAAQMLGQTSSTDVFATFSMPNKGSNHRGYVMYELSEMIDGYIVSSWFNYVHQHSQIQFPVQTAMEFEQTSFLNSSYAFRTIQSALQFSTHGEYPALLE